MIAIACDHAALELKAEVIKMLEERGLEYKDFGTYTTDSCHYPIFGARAAQAVSDGICDRGILICGTGIGMSLVANKVKGIRCALCSDSYSAKMTVRITTPICWLWALVSSALRWQKRSLTLGWIRRLRVVVTRHVWI